jgi:predicted nucleotidyltransferase
MVNATSKVVSAEVAASLAQVREPSLGLLLYGSHARGDQVLGSDVDLLQLVPEPRKSYSKGTLSIVAYTVGQLRSMTQAGSLFAWHLHTEGIILDDRNRELENVLSDHPGPATDRVIGRIRELSAILDVSRDDAAHHGPRLARLARYLLRTAMYARSLEAGEPSFALDRAATAAHVEVLLPLLARRPLDEVVPSLNEYRDGLVELVGAPLAPNVFGTLEALIVNRWETDRQLAVIAVEAMSEDEGELDYELITFNELCTL